MSFLTPSSSDDEPSSDARSGTPSEWGAPPASALGPAFAVPPTVEPYVDVEQFSHAGLSTVDPWTERTSWYHAVWPWGLGGIAETLDVVILALVMFLCVRFVAHNYIVDGASMVPTFEGMN